MNGYKAFAHDRRTADIYAETAYAAQKRMPIFISAKLTTQEHRAMNSPQDFPPFYDCTGHIGPLFNRKDKPAWPMYSFERPGYMLWNAIAGALHAKGWDDEKIKTWLQSKDPRWALDGELGDAIQALGEKFASTLT